ncbi:MAG: polysaccharide deacetylase family protein [Chitinophagales bacterium]|nr:polysaccharide deacetylase family protein [Chitinophagales bacterium]
MKSSTTYQNSHFLSVDLEDWYTSAYLRAYVKEHTAIDRIEQSTEAILTLFDKHQVKATFFVLGSVAEKHPSLIKKIAYKGHEIASHAYSHTPLWNLNKHSFEEEIVKTNTILQNLVDKEIKGFRAPYASLSQDSAWAIDILKDHGFKYDSSIFPMKTPLYGVKNAPLEMYKISSSDILKPDTSSELLEIPFSVYQKFGMSIPCTGGIYGRFLPAFALNQLLAKLAKDRAINFYFHPWEIDKHIPKIPVPLYNYIVSYYNINSYLSKVDRLLKKYSFSSFEQRLNLL